MHALRKLLTCLFFLAPTLASATSSPDQGEISGKLKNRMVFLRGAFVEDQLTFDTHGNPQGPATAGPFSFSAVRIDHLHFSDNSLEIEGHRALLISTSKNDQPQWTDIHETKMKMETVK